MKMDWTNRFCRVCLALSVVLVQVTDGLRFCKADLKGFLFEDTDAERCYEFVYEEKDRRSWSDARDYCQVNGGRMLNIEDQTKQLKIEDFLDRSSNPYQPNPKKYNPLQSMKSTWGNFDPDIWLGATRDSDGNTWRFDQFSTSRTVSSMVVEWFNYGEDPDLLQVQNEKSFKYKTDVCLVMRINYLPYNVTVDDDGDGVFDEVVVRYNITYPWYQHDKCSSADGLKHPFICEYIGYEYRETPPTSNWVIVIGVLGMFVACGFLACTIYCLWEKIHTSYNVLQV